jgi:hypothetical protein
VFVAKFFNSEVPAPCAAKGGDKVAELGAAVAEKVADYVAAMEKVGGILWCAVWLGRRVDLARRPESCIGAPALQLQLHTTTKFTPPPCLLPAALTADEAA